MNKSNKTVMMLSLHHYNSQRRVDFHYIADSFKSMGWNVIFVTTPLSPFSYFTGDHRWRYVSLFDINRPIAINHQVIQYSYAPITSPLSQTGNVIIDYLSPLFINIYRTRLPKNLIKFVKSSDLFIMESNSGLVLFDILKKNNPTAKFVYRADDALETLHPHKSILDYEKEVSPKFDLISVPSIPLLKRFEGYNVILQHHGIQKSIFLSGAGTKPEPYEKYRKNLIFIGIAHLDTSFLIIAAKEFPEYGFHVIGPLSIDEMPPNVMIYGELPHLQTIPFLVHADIGLHTLRTKVGLETYSDSLKVIQYTWCKLPIIAPTGIPSSRSHFVRYVYDDKQSIHDAIISAAAFDRNSIDTSGVKDWGEFTETILNEVSL